MLKEFLANGPRASVQRQEDGWEESEEEAVESLWAAKPSDNRVSAKLNRMLTGAQGARQPGLYPIVKLQKAQMRPASFVHEFDFFGECHDASASLERVHVRFGVIGGFVG
jgi:hypothetical protein